jgi:hypothetical protein
MLAVICSRCFSFHISLASGSPSVLTPFSFDDVLPSYFDFRDSVCSLAYVTEIISSYQESTTFFVSDAMMSTTQ